MRLKLLFLWACANGGTAATYISGTVNTYSCPAGSTRVITDSDCTAASTALGLTKYEWKYMSGMTSNLDQTTYPPGCFQYGTWIALFNDKTTGAAEASSAPICSKASASVSSAGWKVSPSGRRFKPMTGLSHFYGCTQSCKQIGAAPACVRDSLDNDFLALIARKQSSWIGHTDIRREGSFEWVSQGCNSAFEAWHPGEPNDANGVDSEDCTAIWPESSGGWTATWNDVSCDCLRQCICEQGAVLKPEYQSEAYRNQGKCFSNDVFRTPAPAPSPTWGSTAPGEQCKESWCSSPSEDDWRKDCWAGSDSERCTCYQGEAKMLGQTSKGKDGKTYYRYTCCTGGGSYKGEECGDCCGDVVAGIVFIILSVCGCGVCGTAIGLCCCYQMKCCCWQQAQPAPVVVGTGYGYGASPPVAQATVVGTQAQPVTVVGTVVGQPAQATVVAPATGAKAADEDNPNLEA